MAASIALHAVVVPSLNAVESEHPSCAAALNAIKIALEKAEEKNPGVVHELVDAILESEQSKGGEDSIDKLLRVANTEIADYVFKESTPELKNLAARSKTLKGVLAKVPEAIADRPKFLTLIREIATAIKATLEGVSAVFQNNSKLLGGKASTLEVDKKVFVRVSKSFSETLKRFFKDGKRDNVLRAAHRLINQTNRLLRTIKIATES
eukprot:m.112851 g.112851  ORF g.112851 m.112851 type:complete len:208 (+) comp17045_c0_seq1:187-810(+)